MSISTEEQQRLKSFQKVSQKIKTLNNFQNPKQIDDSLTFYKSKLKNKYQEMTREELEIIFQKISDLLLQKTNAKLRQLEYIYHLIPDFLIEEETQKYLLANSKLILLKQKLLEDYGK